MLFLKSSKEKNISEEKQDKDAEILTKSIIIKWFKLLFER